MRRQCRVWRSRFWKVWIIGDVGHYPSCIGLGLQTLSDRIVDMETLFKIACLIVVRKRLSITYSVPTLSDLS